MVMEMCSPQRREPALGTAVMHPIVHTVVRQVACGYAGKKWQHSFLYDIQKRSFSDTGAPVSYALKCKRLCLWVPARALSCPRALQHSTARPVPDGHCQM